MLFKSTTAVAILAVAAQAVAEPQPYKPNNARMLMSTRELFGVVARQNSDGVYAPTETLCGLGETCAEACGANYQTCQSTDNAIHCYNPLTQVCCPDDSGNSCDDGYYCAGSSENDVVCCPVGQSPADCAKAYGVAAVLTSEVAKPTTSSSAPPSSSTTSTSTTSSSTSSTSSSAVPSSSSSLVSSSVAPNTTSSVPPMTTHKTHGNYTAITSWGTSLTTVSCASTAAAATTATAASNNFTTGAVPSPTASTVATSAAGSVKTVGAAVALLAAAFALLL